MGGVLNFEEARQDKQAEEEQRASEQKPQPAPPTIPRIRGDNPPLANLQEAQRITAEKTELQRNKRPVTFGICLTLFLFVAAKFTDDLDKKDTIAVSGLLVLCLTIVLFCWNLSREQKLVSPEAYRRAIPLHTFNTEFTLLLADTSTTSTTILFQISGGHAESLNRMTEAILLRFAATMQTPPNAKEIEDHLETSLVQFQDENQIAVLRVQVLTHIHIPKKKRVEDV